MTRCPLRSVYVALTGALLSTGCAPDGLISLWLDQTPDSVPFAADEGRWTTLPERMDINPIHAVLLHEPIPRSEREELGRPIGKVLVVSGDGDDQAQFPFRSQIRDFSAGTVTSVDVDFDAFCSGITVLANGNPFIVGGTAWDAGLPEGLTDAAVYKVQKGVYEARDPMANRRWYPTATLLGDGRVMVEAGWTDFAVMNSTVEIYTPGVGWSPEYPMPWTPMFYMRKHLLPDGRVFDSGPENLTRMFDPAAVSAYDSGWTDVDWNEFSGTTGMWNREYGTSVLLPLTPENAYNPSVMILGGFRDFPTATTELIDLGAATPEWRSGPDMSGPRVRMNATLLPDGKVVALGGASIDGEELFATRAVDLYDPAAERFSPAGVMAYPHLDHSVALLLPDATVWVAGSQYDPPAYEDHMEVYEPPYLFDADGTFAARPVIDDAPHGIAYGAPFAVDTDEAGDIGSVVLMRPGAVTHSFDTDQRMVGLEFAPGAAGTLDVTGPPDSNIAPPGYYLLFLVTADGVPSVAKFVRLD